MSALPLYLSLFLSCLLPLLTLLSPAQSRAVSLFCLLPALTFSLHPGLQLLLTGLACFVLAARPPVVFSSQSHNNSRVSTQRNYSAAFLAALNRWPEEKEAEHQQQQNHQHQEQHQKQQQLVHQQQQEQQREDKHQKLPHQLTVSPRQGSGVEPWNTGSSKSSSSLLSPRYWVLNLNEKVKSGSVLKRILLGSYAVLSIFANIFNFFAHVPSFL